MFVTVTTEVIQLWVYPPQNLIGRIARHADKEYLLFCTDC